MMFFSQAQWQHGESQPLLLLLRRCCFRVSPALWWRELQKEVSRASVWPRSLTPRGATSARERKTARGADCPRRRKVARREDGGLLPNTPRPP